MQVGDLVQFDYVNGHTSEVNNKVGLYLGPKPLKREDGKIINNFMVQLLGEATPRLCDGSMMRWLRVVECK